MTTQDLLDAIQRFYADKSRSREETLEGLEETRDHLELLIDSLKD